MSCKGEKPQQSGGDQMFWSDPSDGLAQDQDAHEEEHDEEEPHEEAVHDLGDLPPLGDAALGGALVLVRLGDGLHALQQPLVLAHTPGSDPDLPLGRPAGRLLCLSLLGVVDGDQQILLPHRFLPPCLLLPHFLPPWTLLFLAPSPPRPPVDVPAGSSFSVGGPAVGLLPGQRLLPGRRPPQAAGPHLADEADPGQEVEDEELRPLWDGPGLGAAVVNVHNEDGEGGGGGDHRHGSDVVLPWWDTDRLPYGLRTGSDLKIWYHVFQGHSAILQLSNYVIKISSTT